MPTRSLQCQRSLTVAGDGVATRRRVTCLITLNHPRLRCLRCLHCLRLLVGPSWRAGVTWSPGRRSSMILAAVLRTLCSGTNVVMGRPLRMAYSNQDVKAREQKLVWL